VLHGQPAEGHGIPRLLAIAVNKQDMPNTGNEGSIQAKLADGAFNKQDMPNTENTGSIQTKLARGIL
jgi:hypothetical protein